MPITRPLIRPVTPPITRRGLAALTALGLAGCASPPPKAPPPPPADASPLQATAVVDALVTSQGIAGFFPFEGTSVSYTRADMRREENTFKATGVISRFVLGNSADANIVRLDRKLVYTLDAKRAQYTECPISGCATPGTQKEPAPAQQPEPPRASKDEGCKMRVASNNFDVKATGAKRTINGFDTEQHTATWTVVLEDGSKRRSTSLLNAEFWTTPPTPAMRQAQAIELAYARTAVSEVRGLMPEQVQRAMSVFLQDSLSAADKAALFNLSKQFEKVRGQPILTTMRWGYSGEACGGAATDGGAGAGAGAGAAARPSGISGLIGGLAGGKLGEKLGERFGGGNSNSAGNNTGPAPLISLSHEVRRYGVEQVRDSQFVPPPTYRRANP